MNLPHVFAKSTAVVPMSDGNPAAVPGGSHWLADDPLVKMRPDLFTEDCRYGLSWSGDAPPCLAVPPGEDDPALADDESTAAMTSRTRSRVQTGRR